MDLNLQSWGVSCKRQKKVFQLHHPCEVYLVGIHPNPGPTCWSDSLRTLYLNARSLKAIVKSVDDAKKLCKITLLQRLVYGGDYDVVLITETWLNTAIFDTEILPGYTIYRRDRGERAGGVLVAIKCDIQSARRNDLERVTMELVVVELRNGLDKPVLLYCFYHPDIAPDPLTQLNSSLQENGESSSTPWTVLNFSASPPKKIWMFTSEVRSLGNPTSTPSLRKPTSSLGF